MPGKGNPDKIKGKGFDQHPENINRKGPPKKSYATFNDQCKKAGIAKLGKTEYMETIAYLFNCPEEDLKKVKDDKDCPMSLRWLITDFADKTIRAKMWQDYRDWLFGKAMQKHEHTGEDGQPLQIALFTLPDNGRDPT